MKLLRRSISTILILCLLLSLCMVAFAAEYTTDTEFPLEKHGAFIHDVESLLESRQFEQLAERMDSKDASDFVKSLEKSRLNAVKLDAGDRMLRFTCKSNGTIVVLDVSLSIGSEGNERVYETDSYTYYGTNDITRDITYYQYRNGEPYGEFEEQTFNGAVRYSDGRQVSFHSRAVGTVGRPYYMRLEFSDGTADLWEMGGGTSLTTDYGWNGEGSLESWVLENNNALRASWCNPGDYLFGAESDTIVNLSNSIVGDETDNMKKASLINQWVAENIYYDYDNYYGRSAGVYASEDVYEKQRSVCEGYANLTASLLRAQGIPCMKVYSYVLGLSSPGEYTADIIEDRQPANHVTLEVWADGRWVTLDPTWDSRNRYENGSYTPIPPVFRYFDASPEFFAETHLITEHPCAVFADIPDGWAQNEVMSAITADLVPYDLQGDYRENMTRAEFAKLAITLLAHLYGTDADGVLDYYNEHFASEPCVMDENAFIDCNDPYVLTAYALQIVNGRRHGIFDPDGKIKREEAAAMLVRTAKKCGKAFTHGPQYEVFQTTMTDYAQLSDWAKEEAGYLYEWGVMNGMTKTTFSPEKNYTRQQSVVTFVRLYNYLK